MIEREARERFDRWAPKRWSLTEIAAIFDPETSFRVLTSWLSGDPIRITPKVWGVEELGKTFAPFPDEKPTKRSKYGLPNLLQVETARRLFKGKANREMVQMFCDHIAAQGSTLAFGYYLILTGNPEKQMAFYWPDKDALVEAISTNPAPLPQCFIFNYGEVFNAVFDRLAAWEKRQPYIAKRSDVPALQELTASWQSARLKLVSAGVAKGKKGK
jgi:hypothetical protein